MDGGTFILLYEALVRPHLDSIENV